MPRIRIAVFAAFLFVVTPAPGFAQVCPHGTMNVHLLTAFGYASADVPCQGIGNTIWRAEFHFNESKASQDAGCRASNGTPVWGATEREPGANQCKEYPFESGTIHSHSKHQPGKCCRRSEDQTPMKIPPNPLPENAAAACEVHFGAIWQPGSVSPALATGLFKATCRAAMNSSLKDWENQAAAAKKNCLIDPDTNKERPGWRFAEIDVSSYTRCFRDGATWDHERSGAFLCCRQRGPMDSSIASPPHDQPPLTTMPTF